MTTAIESLSSTYAAYLAAHGDRVQSPLIPLMESALGTGDEAVAAAVLAHVERSRPKETAALAAVKAIALDELTRVRPEIVLAVDVAGGLPPMSDPVRWIRDEAQPSEPRMAVAHGFALWPASPLGERCVARILFRGGARTADTRVIDGAMRILAAGIGSHASRQENDRAALLAAAVATRK